MMLDNISLSEIILFVIGTLFSVIGFFLRDLHARLANVETGLQNHRVEDAKDLVPRVELLALTQTLRDDIRGMISPLNTKVENIDNYLREKGNGV